jgi:hypothetical protein
MLLHTHIGLSDTSQFFLSYVTDTAKVANVSNSAADGQHLVSLEISEKQGQEFFFFCVPLLRRMKPGVSLH